MDQSALVAIARIPARTPEGRGDVFILWPAAIAKAGTEVTASARAFAATRAKWKVLSYETNGLGAGASQVLRDEILKIRRAEESVSRMRGGEFISPVGHHNPTVTTWARKADALGRLRTLAEGGHVLFARHEQFMRQLATVRVEHRQHSVGIEAPQGGHDDLVDAAYLATGSWTGSDGTIRNVLAEGALRSTRSVPAFPSTETVETEGGVVVPKRPPLVSVIGDAVTPPIGGAPEGEHPAVTRLREQIQNRKKEQTR